MDKKYLIISLIVGIVLLASAVGAGVYFKNRKTSADDNHEDFHAHAGFKIFVDGKYLDLSDDKYMHLSVCGDDHEDEANLPIEEKIHLHNNIGDVAHIHAEGIIWRNLFESLQLEDLLDNFTAIYINGTEVIAGLEQPISDLDSAVIIIGDPKGVDVQKETLTKEYILEKEKLVESCSS